MYEGRIFLSLQSMPIFCASLVASLFKCIDQVEHYLELYSRENVLTETAINAAEPLPVMRELDEYSMTP